MACLTTEDFEQLSSGVLDDDTSAAMHDHLGGCATCRAAFDAYRSSACTVVADNTPVDDVTVSASTIATGRPRPAHAQATQPKIEGYRITGVLGQGGMGIVYRAVQDKLNRTVALKVLPAMIGDANPSAVARFRREATAAAKLHHTNIIPIYDYGESNDAYYYAMELVVGTPLNEVIDRVAESSSDHATEGQLNRALSVLDDAHAMPVDARDSAFMNSDSISDSIMFHTKREGYFRRVATWIRDTADALQYAHDQGIIHRDIKPANLILAHDGRIMVADFGLAKSSDDPTVTAAGAILGTLRYMSPEQSTSGESVDGRADIYSLGATMYELLCRRPAFASMEHNELLADIREHDPVSPQRVSGAIPGELATICMKCLEKSPGARYASAKDLADDLRRFASDLPILAKRPSVWKRTVKFVRRHRVPCTIATAVVLVAASSFLWQRESAVRRHAQVSAYHDSAMTYALTNRWKKAEADLQAAIRIQPKNVQTLLTLAWLKLQYNTTNPSEAGDQSLKDVIRTCRQILHLDGDNIKALGYLGVAQRRLERYPEAIKTLKLALKVNETDYGALTNLGSLYAVTGDLDQAEKSLRKAVELGGVAQDAWHAAIWRNLAMLEWFLGRKEAFEHVATAIECDRTDELSWVLRARLGLRGTDRTRVEEALDDAKHADRLVVFKDGRTKRIRAMGHLKLGQWDQAISQAKLAIELGDQRTINELIEAVALARSGTSADAVPHLARAEQDWPSKLRIAGGFQASAGTGNLWIESADEWISLADEARTAIAAASK